MAHIVIDTRALQTPSSRARGIGLSVRAWLSTILGMPQHHRITLLTDPRFDPHGLPETGPFWSTVMFESDPRINEPSNLVRELAAHDRTEAFLHAIGADLYHCTSPMEAHFVVGLTSKTVPTVVTFYDAMPALEPERFFAGVSAQSTAAYFARLHALRHASHVIAISDASAHDLRKTTAMDASRVSVGHLAAAADHLPPDEAPSDSAGWRQQAGGEFVLAVLGASPWKNTERAIAGFMRWIHQSGAPHRLIIAFDLPAHQRAEAQRWLECYDAAERVLFTGFVSAEHMRWLYWHCDIVLHPALLEGFGMPVLEALIYGKPVVTSNASSMKEIAHGAGVLVDPLNIDDIARGLADARAHVGDPERARLARARAAEFSWDATAQHILSTYERVLAAPVAAGADNAHPAQAKPEQPLTPWALSRARMRAHIEARHVKRPAAWRRWLTSHVDAGYLTPALARQNAFNNAVIDYLHRYCTRAMGADSAPDMSANLPEPVINFKQHYRVTSMIRRHATSHLLGTVCEIMLRKQSDFNAWLQAFLYDPDDALLLRQLMNLTKVHERGYQPRSNTPVLSNSIVTVRTWLTRHLTSGYIDGIASDLEAFNESLIDIALQLHAHARLKRWQD